MVLRSHARVSKRWPTGRTRNRPRLRERARWNGSTWWRATIRWFQQGRKPWRGKTRPPAATQAGALAGRSMATSATAMAPLMPASALPEKRIEGREDDPPRLRSGGGGWRTGSLLEAAGFLPHVAQGVVDRLRREHGDLPPASMGDELVLMKRVLVEGWRNARPMLPTGARPTCWWVRLEWARRRACASG